MIPSMARSEDFTRQAEEIRRGALAEAKGDTSSAFVVLSIKTAQVTDVANVTQAELEVCQGTNERFKNYVGYNNKSISEKISDSSFTKVAIFIVGFWIGTTAVNAAN